MTKATILVAALGLFAAGGAHAANLTGTWTGSGSAVDNQGKTINCESVVLTISQTATNLTVNSAFTCGGTAITIPGGAMDIRGGDLFDKGVKAGSITDSSVSLVAKAKGYTMQSDAQFDNTTMRLHSVISVGNNPAPALTFDAKNLRR